MLSILIPVYNYDVTQLVKELRLQALKTGVNFEILIIDDCSPHQELQLINQRVKHFPECSFLINEKNLGRTATRNRLAEKARFEYLLFIDADVIPARDNFIQSFIDHVKKKKHEVIFGGIAYRPKDHKPETALRWKFGNKRENKSLEQRKKTPYLSVISGCVCIQKKCFLNSNTFLEHRYGVDVLFTQDLKKRKVRVLHLNNPAFHLGLEKNDTFLHKTEQAMQSLAFFEQKGFITNDYSKIQRVSRQLQAWRATNLFVYTYQVVFPLIKKNLLSKKPSLRAFDCFKLNTFITAKKQHQRA